MVNDVHKNDLFCDYYEQWVTVYKKNLICTVLMENSK